MFPSAGALSEGAMTSHLGEQGLQDSENVYLLSLCLSFARSLDSALDLKGCSCEGGKKEGRKEKRKRNEERKKKGGSERGGGGQATLLLSTWRELALCLVKIVSGTREKAHNICKRPVRPDCRALSECVNPR